MTDRINLTQLREQRPEEIILTQHYDPARERDPEDDYTVAVVIPPATLLALIDAAEAAQQLINDSVTINVGHWNELEQALARFDHT